jgi:hypothetical protein
MTTTPHPLQAAIDKIGLSQKKLAKLAGIPQSVVCQVINGSGGRHRFSSDSAAKMLPHLVDPKTGAPLMTLADLIYPPGKIPASVQPAPARARRRR